MVGHCGVPFELNESDNKINFVLNSQLTCKIFLLTVFLSWEAKNIISDSGVLALFFSENNRCARPPRIRFSIVILCL